MQLSQKPKTSSEFFFEFLKSSLDLKHFQKKDDFHSSDISKITDSKKDGQINFKKFIFSGSLGKQHGKRAKTWLKFEWRHFYHIYRSL